MDKPEIIQPTFSEIRDAIYSQWRVNQSRGLNGDVDILASSQYADHIHGVLQSLRGIPKCETATPREDVIPFEYRSYSSELFDLPRGFNVHIFIPSGDTDIFSIPDYIEKTYFDLLRKEKHDFPATP